MRELPEMALITLGVASGPPPLPHQAGISSVLKIGRALYLIDCGRGSLDAFTDAGLRFEDLTAIFITHLHTDHYVDYFSYFVCGGFLARAGRAPVRVYGPGPAGGLLGSHVGDDHPATVEPDDPTPGIAAITESFIRAYAYPSNIFIRSQGNVDVRDLVDVTEIEVPPGSDYRNRAPLMSPFPVMADENVTVTAILVPHHNVYPSFALRFELPKAGVSVTFSGDTTKSDNVIGLAADTDVLVHESVFSLDPDQHVRYPAEYMRCSHTSAVEVGEVAAAARAKHVIVSHYSPQNLPDEQWHAAIGQNYAGRITIAKDGDVFPL